MKGHHIVRVVSIVLGIFCVYAGVLKFVRVEDFEIWNYPPALIFAVGVVEIVSAVLVVLPITRRYGAVGLASLMVLAISTHLYNGNGKLIAVPVVLLLLAGFIVYRCKTDLHESSASE